MGASLAGGAGLGSLAGKEFANYAGFEDELPSQVIGGLIGGVGALAGSHALTEPDEDEYRWNGDVWWEDEDEDDVDEMVRQYALERFKGEHDDPSNDEEEADEELVRQYARDHVKGKSK
jgi:hypothetical protein